MKCTYIIKKNKVPIGEYSYKDLVDFILKNQEALTTSGVTDIVFSQSTELNETEALLNKIKSAVTTVIGLYDNISGENKEKIQSAGYISVTDFLEQAKTSDGRPFITSYDLNLLKAELIKYWVNELKMKSDEAKLKVENDLKTWEEIGNYAAKMHSVVRAYFNGAKDVNALATMFLNDFPISVIKSDIYSGLQLLELHIKLRHGDDVVIMAGLKVDSPLTDRNDKLLGTIDIIAIDNKGQAHIYYMKGSANTYGSMIDVRLRKQDYTLGFYRHMLASKGLAVRDMSLNIAPVRILLDDLNNVNKVIFEQVEDRLATANRNGMNRLQWGSGEFYNNINSKVDVKLTLTSTINGLLKNEVMEDLSKFFPNKRIKTLRWERTRDEFIKNSVRVSDDPSKGAWMFYAFDLVDPIYIKEDSPKELNSELVKKVDAYLLKSENSSKEYIHNLCNSLESVLKGTTPVERLAPKNNPFNRHALTVAFSKYIKGEWSLVKNELLESLGIIAFLNNNTKQVDFMSLSFHSGILNNIINLGLGTSILGSFKKDPETIIDPKILRATNGNIDLMKIMVTLNRVPNLFNGIFKIGKISALDITTGRTTLATTEEITRSFSQLCKEAGIANNIGLIDFASLLDLLLQDIEVAYKLGILSADLSNNIFSDLERVNVLNTNEVLRMLNNVRLSLENTYSQLADGEALKAALQRDDTLAVMYVLLLQTINHFNGCGFTQSLALPRISGSLKEGTFLGGTKVANPLTLPDYNLRKIANITSNAFTNMNLEILDLWEPFRNKTIKKLWDSKGFTWQLNAVIGNLNHLYTNMFERTNGELNGMIMVKNPYDSSSGLTEGEREFLKEWLWRINKLRFNLGNTKETDLKVVELKKDKRWYWVPLTEAASSSKMQQVNNPKSYISRELGNLKNWAKRNFGREEENLYTEEERQIQNEYRERYEIFNRFSLSDTDSLSRAELLDLHPSDFWERNLETVYAKYLYAHVRKKHLDKVLPIIKGIKLAGLMYGHLTGVDMTAFDEYIDNYLKSHIHNQSILDEEMRNMLSYVGPLKYIGSALALGFNINTGLRNTLESIWKVPSRLISKFYNNKDMFNKEDYFKAVGVMVADAGDFVLRVTLIEALNLRFRMQDMDANRIAEKIVSNKAGILNAKDRFLFWTSTAPDYFNRMSMLIALMIHDGSWDACSFDEDGFHYDWKKDKRFEVYASGNKNNPKYNELRGLYLMLLNSTNELRNTKLKEGDLIPLPYTNELITALKAFSDSVYGFYDHDLRAMIERTALGSLFLQFLTYLTAARTTYLLSPGGYNVGEYEQLTDERTGKPMWLKTITDENGNETTVPTIEDTGVPYYGIKNSYMEGIVYTLKSAFKDLRTDGFKAMWNSIKENDVKKNNMKLFAYNMTVLLLVSALLKFLVSKVSEYRKENAPDVKTISSVIGDLSWTMFSKALLGSTQDFNIIDSLYSISLNAEPAAFGILSNFATSTVGLVRGDKSFESYLYTNFGAYRSVSTLLQGLAELGEGVEGTTKNISE